MLLAEALLHQPRGLAIDDYPPSPLNCVDVLETVHVHKIGLMGWWVRRAVRIAVSASSGSFGG